MGKGSRRHFAPRRLGRAAVILLAFSVTVLVATLALRSRAFAQAGEKDADQQRRETIIKNLRQLATAMHNHQIEHGSVPLHAIYSNDGKPLLSWRVALLPYLGKHDLYKQFRFNEPWDSEHNKKLLDKMPPIYAPVGVKTKDKHTTFFQVFVGPGSVFEAQRPIKLRQISEKDGASNTAMILEAAKAVPWTKPADLEFAANKPLPKLGSLASEGGSYACTCAGDTLFIRRDIPDRLLRQLVGFDDAGAESYQGYVRPTR
jgi:hypothetical protein